VDQPELPASDPDPYSDSESGPRAYEPPDASRPASSSPTEGDLEREWPGGSRAKEHNPYAALRIADFRRYISGSVVSVIGQQMLGVAVGWELYERTHSATALGLVGLAQALPIIVLALPAGHLADRLDRKRIVLATQVLAAFCSLGLAITSYRHDAISDLAPIRLANVALERAAMTCGEADVRFVDRSVPLMFLFLFLMGVARAFNDPARATILPQIVPLADFGNAVTWSSSGFQIASMVGPALGGLVVGYLDGYSFNYALAYLSDAACALVTFGFILPMAVGGRREGGEMTITSLAAGMRFVWRTKIILATITLDMFAVLLGGAVALLPIFAKDILHSNATGLGWLRAAPSIGAFLMALLLAHMPPMQKAGKTLLWAVAGFGVATIVFGLSRNFWLSFTMLLLTGAFDNISVVVRHTLVQVLTPDELRGRVSAINYVFIGTSNELGAFESGLTTAAFGPIWSVVGGGIGTILVVIAVALIWPQVVRFGRLDRAHASG
jgi:MFS family permease